jgi:hypothetical protein
MRSSRGTPIEGTAPMRLTMSEKRSSSVIRCSVSRPRTSNSDSCAKTDTALAITGKASSETTKRFIFSLPRQQQMTRCCSRTRKRALDFLTCPASGTLILPREGR